MPNVQEWLNQKYPNKEERKNLVKIEIIKQNWITTYGENLQGHLDLSDFVNLEVVRCEWNKLTSLDLSNCSKLTRLICNSNKLTRLNFTNCPNLVEINCWRNEITANLNIFSRLTKLKRLDLGISKEMNEKNPNFSNNNFSGSLKALKNCRELEYVCIGYQTNIKGGLEYLPIEKLTYFGCDNTEFKEVLKSYNYDVYAWQLAHPELMAKVKHPDKEKVIMELEEEITEKDKLVNELELKIADTKKELENVKTNEAEKTEKIARLESKLKELEKAKQNLENELKIERDHAKDLDEWYLRQSELPTTYRGGGF